MEQMKRAGVVRLIVLVAVALSLLAAPVALADNGTGGVPFPSPEGGVDYVALWTTVQALSLIY